MITKLFAKKNKTRDMAAEKEIMVAIEFGSSKIRGIAMLYRKMPRIVYVRE